MPRYYHAAISLSTRSRSLAVAQTLLLVDVGPVVALFAAPSTPFRARVVMVVVLPSDTVPVVYTLLHAHTLDTILQ